MLATSTSTVSRFRRSPSTASVSAVNDLDVVSETILAVPSLESTSVLRGERSIAIWHNGSVYRLQATRLGKLILTK